MIKQVTITALQTEHAAAWRRLYDGYATFYRREMNDTVADNVWRWLMDPGHELEGAIAMLGTDVVGLVHYRRMPSPLRGTDIGFMDDLFVDPSARGSNIGGELIAHVQRVARERGWPLVRWLTEDNNYRARALYDRMGKKTMWNLYEALPADE